MAKLTRYLLEGHCYHTISVTRSRRPIFTRDDCATVVVDAINSLRGQDKAYVLAYAVLQDHVHLLLVPREPATISIVMHSLKSYTANRLNKLLGTSGAIWQQSFYDRVIRNDAQLETALRYIHENPVGAGLVRVPGQYLYSSAHQSASTDLEAFLSE
jgi:REP element-mobilizing transposase RayT